MISDETFIENGQSVQTFIRTTARMEDLDLKYPFIGRQILHGSYVLRRETESMTYLLQDLDREYIVATGITVPRPFQRYQLISVMGLAALRFEDLYDQGIAALEIQANVGMDT